MLYTDSASFYSTGVSPTVVIGSIVTVKQYLTTNPTVNRIKQERSD